MLLNNLTFSCITTVFEFKGIFAPVNILDTVFFFKYVFCLSPATILLLFIKILLLLLRLLFNKAYPSTAELLNGGKYNLLTKSLAKNLFKDFSRAINSEPNLSFISFFNS